MPDPLLGGSGSWSPANYVPGTLPLVNAFERQHGKACPTRGMCMSGYKKLHATAARHVEGVRRRNPALSASKDVYGIAPGTEIWYDGAFKIPGARHHGVYIGDGLVVDVGSIPKTCTQAVKKVIAKSFDSFEMKAQGIGLRRLADFVNGGARWGVAEYPPGVALPPGRVMANALRFIGPQPYSVRKDNCQHTASLIVTGVYQSDQARRVNYVVMGVGGAIAAVAGLRRRRGRKP